MVGNTAIVGTDGGAGGTGVTVGNANAVGGSAVLGTVVAGGNVGDGGSAVGVLAREQPANINIATSERCKIVFVCMMVYQF